MLQPGTILENKYRVEAIIGRGGFGYVYRARERLTGEIVAIKELVPSFVDDQQMVQRFIQEARATLHLTHPNIARTHTIFQDRGTYYLAMEYLPGGSLADRLEGGSLPREEAMRIASRLCRALSYAHGEGVVHCDIKPPNVLFDQRGRVRLAPSKAPPKATIAESCGATWESLVTQACGLVHCRWSQGGTPSACTPAATTQPPPPIA